MKRKIRDNGLSLAMFGIFLLCWAGQAVAGYHDYNSDQKEHGQSTVTFTRYFATGHFWEATLENWESEFLQMGAYVVLTVFLVQCGAADSKDPDGGEEEVDREPDPKKKDAPRPVRRGGWRLKLYENSLSIALLTLFLLSFLGHAAGGAKEYNEEQIEHGQQTVTMAEFMNSSHFWFQSMQNWQSEFLSIGMLVVLSIYLRQKGSPESKPVDAPDKETGK
jgi:hypothetical protein